MKGRNKTMPDFSYVEDLPATLIEDMKRHGMFRCCVLSPNCTGEAFAQIYRPSCGMYAVFCRKHTPIFCVKECIHMTPRKPKPSDN